MEFFHQKANCLEDQIILSTELISFFQKKKSLVFPASQPNQKSNAGLRFYRCVRERIGS